MPTKLGSQGYRRFDNQTQTVSRSKGAQAGEPTIAWLRGPWAGFEPDMEPSQATPGSARLASNLIDKNGALTQQDGFARIDAAKLPLGDPSLPSASAEPVVGIFTGRTNATQAIRRYALTADDSTDGSSLYGHLFELVAGVWTHRTAVTAANSYKGIASDPGATLADATHFAVGDYTVFVGGTGGNQINRFPSASDAAKYDIMDPGSLTSIGAQSICASEERLMAFNTNEAGTIFPGRLRWTNKGANAKWEPVSNTGSGFADFNEFGSEGLCVRNIGPKIALYFLNGVQFIRRTGLVTDPFAKDYAAYGRGLLSTHSLVDVGNGTHFGLFTDGWYYLNFNGNWQEVGTTSNGYYRWKRTFYEQLDWINRARVTMDYDPVTGNAYIGWPISDGSPGSHGPTTVWIYNLKTDTLWPAPDWPQQPNIISSWIEEDKSGALWSDMAAPWATTPGSWSSYGPVVGRQRIVHGTGGGLVHQHNQLLTARDGALPAYNYSLSFFSGDHAEQLKRLNRAYISYTRQSMPTPVTLTLEGNNGHTVSGTVKHTKGTTGEKQVDFVSGPVTDFLHSVTLGGIAPVQIDGLGLQRYAIDSTVRKQQ